MTRLACIKLTVSVLFAQLILCACYPVSYPAPSQLQQDAAGVVRATVAVNETQAAQQATAQSRADRLTQMAFESTARQSTKVAIQDAATLTALVPTDTPTLRPTATLTPSPRPTLTPVPTQTPTPNQTATKRAALVADAQTWGSVGLWIGLPLVLIVGLFVCAGAKANSIDAVSRAEAEAIRTKASAEADAIRTKSEAEAERMRHFQVGGNIVSTTPGGVQIVSMGGEVAEDRRALAPLPTFPRISNGGKRVDDVDRLGDMSRKAVAYLRLCAEKVGWEAQVLPTVAEFGNNGLRQPVINAMKAAGLARSYPGGETGGTHLCDDYPTIGKLHDALIHQLVTLDPPPPRPGEATFHPT